MVNSHNCWEDSMSNYSSSRLTYLRVLESQVPTSRKLLTLLIAQVPRSNLMLFFGSGILRSQILTQDDSEVYLGWAIVTANSSPFMAHSRLHGQLFLLGKQEAGLNFKLFNVSFGNYQVSSKVKEGSRSMLIGLAQNSSIYLYSFPISCTQRAYMSCNLFSMAVPKQKNSLFRRASSLNCSLSCYIRLRVTSMDDLNLVQMFLTIVYLLALIMPSTSWIGRNGQRVPSLYLNSSTSYSQEQRLCSSPIGIALNQILRPCSTKVWLSSNCWQNLGFSKPMMACLFLIFMPKLPTLFCTNSQISQGVCFLKDTLRSIGSKGCSGLVYGPLLAASGYILFIISLIQPGIISTGDLKMEVTQFLYYFRQSLFPSTLFPTKTDANCAIHQKTSVFKHVHWAIILEKQMYELTINDQAQNINNRRSCIINILPLNTRLGGMQEEKYNNYHSKAQHQAPNNNQPKTLKSVELQVNISIGKNKFLLQVHRCSHLHQEVLQFLKLHQINLKYEGPILAMVREKLSKKQIFKGPVDNQMQELKKVKSQMENKRKLLVQQEDKPQTPNKHKKYEGSITNDQAKQNNQYNSNTKHGISTGQSEAQSHVREVPKQNIKTSADESKCQNVYERWKVKEKIKETERIKNTHPTEKQGKNKTAHFKSTANEKQQDRAKEKSASHKNLQSHSPDYFYKKGIKFRQAKQVHVEEMYKDKYPFQIKKEATITPTKKDQLHERLFKQYELREKSKLDKQIGNLRIEKEEQKKPAMDKYKQKIIERDHQIDKALGYLISNKMIENPYKIENVSKSPFRKINLCNP